MGDTDTEPKRGLFASLDDPWPEDEVTGQIVPTSHARAVEVAAEIVEAQRPEVSKREALLDEIRGIEDQLLLDATEAVSAAVNFAELPSDAKEYPIEWETERGWSKEKCEKILRIVQAAWLNAKNAPVGLAIAQRTHSAIIKSRAQERAAPKALALFFLPQHGAEPDQLPERFDE